MSRGGQGQYLWRGRPGWWSPFSKRGTGGCAPTIGDHTTHPPGKVYSKVLERSFRPIVEPQLQEEQCGFRPGCGTVDQLFTLAGLLGGAREFAHPVYMCFVDLRRLMTVSPRGILQVTGYRLFILADAFIQSDLQVVQTILWGVLREYGVPGRCTCHSVLVQTRESCVRRTRSRTQATEISLLRRVAGSVLEIW